MFVFVLHGLAIFAKMNWDVVWVEWGATDVADFGASCARKKAHYQSSSSSLSLS